IYIPVHLIGSDHQIVNRLIETQYTIIAIVYNTTGRIHHLSIDGDIIGHNFILLFKQLKKKEPYQDNQSYPYKDPGNNESTRICRIGHGLTIMIKGNRHKPISKNGFYPKGYRYIPFTNIGILFRAE